MAELPTGTVTFLFTDLEGSTRLWEQHPDAMRDALARHDDILRATVEAQDGVVFSEMGDGMAVAFPSASCALHACLDAQRGLLAESWGDTPLKARMGLHAGDGLLRADGQYVNAPLNRCARLMAVAHGGQVVLSDAVETLVRDRLPPDASLVDLGEHRLRDLANSMRVYQLVHPDLPREFPRLKSLGRDTNLPVQLTTFVGRERELEELSVALGESRVVTLTGVGGVGKTRLALQFAAEILPRFADGAWFVELAPVSDPDAIADTIATALDIPGAAGQAIETTIVEDLRRRSLLLVLDNCEHVLDRIADLAGGIIRSCPEVVVLATSREGLALPGERIYAVPSLPVPAEHASLDSLRASDAVQLFVERAASVRGDFDLTPENADGVVAICRRLDGVPLALELAAARVTTLHPSQIAQRLDERFRLLTAGRRTAVERHQTLRATIDWSYDLLSPQEQVALNRMAVFAGGCTLEAAEAVLAHGEVDAFDVLDLLGRLVEQSLAIATDAGTERRYRLLETIRQYAAERLAEAHDTEAALERHADYNRSLAAEIGPGLRGPDEREWLTVYETEVENLRTAVTWFADSDNAEAALGLVFDLYALVFFESSQSVIELAAIAATAPSAATHPLSPAATTLMGEHAIQSGEPEHGQRLIDAANAAQSVLPTPPHPVMLFSQFRVAMLFGDWDACFRCLDPLLVRADVLDDEFLHAWLLNAAGAIAVLNGRPDDGVSMLQPALALARRTGNPAAIGMSAGALAWTMRDDDPDTALALFDEAITVGGPTSGLAISLAYGNRAILHARAGRPREAVRDGRAAVAVVERDQERNTFGGAMTHLSIALAELGRFEGAVTLFGAAAAIIPIATNDAFGWQRIEGKVRAVLGRAEFDAAFARGSGLGRDGALALLDAELDAVEAELGDA